MKTIIQKVTNPLDSTPDLSTQIDINKISEPLSEQGFVFVPGRQTYSLLLNARVDLHEHWRAFRDSWDHLSRDTFMADGGKYRFRRHAVYALYKHSRQIVPVTYRPHYQSLDHNSLNGGIARYFSPISTMICSNPVFSGLLALCRDVFCAVAPARGWHIEVHQFRIETCGAAASPTPEGMHRDGVDYVFMMLINRHQVAGGTTTLADGSGACLAEHTFTDELEAAFVDDKRLYHGVSPVQPAHPGSRGYRDMLVITFRET